MKIILFANTDWYLYNFRLSLARQLKEEGHDVLLLSPAGEYGPKLQQLGFRWKALPMERRSLNPLRELRLIFWLQRLLKQERPELIHGFTIKSAVYGSLAAQMARIPARVNAVAGLGYVFTSTDMKARILRPVVRGLMRLALRGDNSRLILQNPDDLGLFEQAGIVDLKSIRVIKGSGVDCRRFSARAPEQYNQTAPLRALLAARLLWDKGIAEYVAAARTLRQEGYNIQFLLAGAPDEGNPAAVSKEEISCWVKEGLIEWLGHVNNMPKLLSEIDVMVLPSYREGLPKTLIEAGACAVPLITTDVPGCREVVSEHGVDGLRVPAKDSAALAAAIRLLDENREMCRTLGQAARKKALLEFDEQIVLRKTISVYEELIGR